ncbi:hypothetical protein J4438_00575 [Candidatus Woesearchaeota archaeon]|nr:hypothetical protein [Candidatus Woesearchaeota archaeon]
MADKKKMIESCSCCPSKGFFMFKGIVAILLGLILWFDYLSFSQVIAITFVLYGIKKLFYGCCSK